MLLPLPTPRSLLPLRQFSQPPRSPTKPNPDSFLLSLLSQGLTLPQAKSIHAQILKRRNLHCNAILTLLHSLYPSSSSSSSSALLSSLLRDADLLTFNLLIKSFSSSNPSLALHLFYQMLASTVLPDKFTLPSALVACASLRSLPLILSIHAISVKSGVSIDAFVVSALIHAYSNCGRTDCALQLLDEFPNPDLPTYNSTITGLSNQGEYESALRVFARMRVEGLAPNRTTLSCVITASGRIVDRKLGKVIHGHVVKAGQEVSDDVSVNSALVFMYPRFGDLDSATLIFQSMPERNVVSWNSMIGAHAQCGNAVGAWGLFSEMLVEGFNASEVTMTCMISVSQDLKEGRMMHGFAIKVGLGENEITGAALISMYVRVDSLADARKLFDEMPRREMGSWNSLILGYSRTGHSWEALDLFYTLRDHTDLRPNSISFIGALSACAALGAVKEGEAIHDYIRSTGIEMDLVVNTSLIDMYCKCGNVRTAKEIFDRMSDKDVVAWKVMISGHGFNGQVREAMELFDRMRRVCKPKPDDVTFTSLLSAFSHIGTLEEVKSTVSSRVQW